MTESVTREVLDRWREVPADAHPRPLVLVDGYVRVQDGGFVDSASKIAFLSGAVDSGNGVDVPGPVLALLCGASAGRASKRLEITAVEQLDYPFHTDRGPAPLPSYAVTVPGAQQPVIVLDPDTPVWWPREPSADPQGEGGTATIEADQRTLHVLAGGVSTEFVRCDFIETDTAVMALPVTTQRRDGRNRAIRAVLQLRPVTGTLERPLGGRILITASGDPITVLPAPTDTVSPEPR